MCIYNIMLCVLGTCRCGTVIELKETIIDLNFVAFYGIPVNETGDKVNC